MGDNSKMSNSKKYEIDMCNGTIMDKLVTFAVPLMLSGILQLMFNAVDIIVVGRFSGSQASGCGRFYHSIDQCIYKSFYRGFPWGKRTGCKILCSRKA